MSGRVFTDAAKLLNDLLTRLETHPAARRLTARVDEAAFASVQDEAACMARLEAAERTGGVRIVRRRIDGVDRVQHVALADPAALYAHLSRAPSRQTVDVTLAAYRRAAPSQVQAVLDEIAEAWARKVGRYGLPPGAASALEKTLKLVTALEGRTANSGAAEIDYRTFSRAAVGDSKALDRLKGPTLRLLRRLSPNAPPAELDEAEALASLGIVRLPQPFLASGPLALDGVPWPPATYLGLPPEAVERLTLTRSVDYVLTIENFTSFVRHAREVNADRGGLVLYSGGFPSRGALRGIVRLATLAAAPTFHWGDIDPGGLRIFRYLETALRECGVVLRPHLMSDALRAQGERSAGAAKIKLGGSAGSAIAALWDAMAADPIGRGLEQEALDPQAPT